MKTRKRTGMPIAVGGRLRNERGLEWEVDLADLSAGGCRLPEAGAQLAVGEPVRLHIAIAGTYRAKVSWRQGKDVGIAFCIPLANHLVDRLMARDCLGPSSVTGALRFPAELAWSC